MLDNIHYFFYRDSFIGPLTASSPPGIPPVHIPTFQITVIASQTGLSQIVEQACSASTA